MQIVIELSDEKYNDIQAMDWKNPIWAGEVTTAIHKGTVLPEHHGDLPSVTPKTGKWIPVSERLPEEGKSVLVWYEYFRFGDYNRMFSTYGIGWQYDEHWLVDNGGMNQRVFAWMPLPEPYKEVSE